jgi:hypothetical protein
MRGASFHAVRNRVETRCHEWPLTSHTWEVSSTQTHIFLIVIFFDLPEGPVS